MITLVAFAFRGRGALQRVLDMMIAVLGGWTIVAACTFGGRAVRWLSFSEAAALCALGVIGLVLHQLRWNARCGAWANWLPGTGGRRIWTRGQPSSSDGRVVSDAP